MREGVQVKGFEAAKGGRFGAAEARHMHATTNQNLPE
jgi:hypothetical protein